VIAGLLILALAVLAWPLLASFLAFTDVGQGKSLVAGAVGLVAGIGIGAAGKGASGPSAGPASQTGTNYGQALETENTAAMAQAINPVTGGISAGSTAAMSTGAAGGIPTMAGAAGGTGAGAAGIAGGAGAAAAGGPVVMAVQKVTDTAMGMANTLQEGMASMAHHSGLTTPSHALPNSSAPIANDHLAEANPSSIEDLSSPVPARPDPSQPIASGPDTPPPPTDATAYLTSPSSTDPESKESS
jgi:hypothetical protein